MQSLDSVSERNEAAPLASRRSRQTIIEPISGWHFCSVKELWEYRELLWVLTVRDIKVRYKQTVLGILWAVLQPLLLMVVFSIFFGHLARMPSDGLPYPIFVYAGLLPWTFFSTSVSNAAGSLVASTHLVTKVYFPRLMIPLSSIGSAFVDYVIASVILLCLMGIYRVGGGSNLLLAPILVAGTTFAALGVGLALAALNVTYRDFRYVVPFLMQFWMFATPVVYPATLAPESWRWLLYVNPMAGFVEGFRAAFLGVQFDIAATLISFATSLLIFTGSLIYFGKVERRFADVI